MKLEEYIHKAKSTRYEESRHDCIMWVAGWVDINIQTSFVRDLAKTYKSINEGLRKHAPSGIADAIDNNLNEAGVYSSNTLLKGAVCIMDNGFPAIYDGESCLAPLPAMAGLAMINPCHIIKHYNLP